MSIYLGEEYIDPSFEGRPEAHVPHDLKSIDLVEQQKLESGLGYRICPLAVRGQQLLPKFGLGVFGLECGGLEIKIVYPCGKGGETEERRFNQRMLRPCSMEYAKTCPAYVRMN